MIACHFLFFLFSLLFKRPFKSGLLKAALAVRLLDFYGGYLAQRNPTFVPEFDGALFRAKLKSPA